MKKKLLEQLLFEDIKIGSDVEYFVKDITTGEIVSAEGLVEGTKDEPYKFKGPESWFATSLDNVTYEGNIPPAESAEEFLAYMQELRNYMDNHLPATIKTLAQGSATLDHKYLQTDNARTFGCASSNNVWTEKIEHVKLKKGLASRGAGYHLHFGYKKPDYDKNIILIKGMDAFLGVPSVIIDQDQERRKVGYGKAGNHRHSPWGCEYRTLSSFMASSDELIKWSYNQALNAINFLNEGGLVKIADRGDEIQSIINGGDVKAAEAFVKEFNIELV